MMELFHVEAENQTGILTAGLLELERNPGATHLCESLMRAAHSLKGAARIVNLQIGVRVAHAMEDCFVAAQQGRLVLRHDLTDVLLRGVDLLQQLAKQPEADVTRWEAAHQAEAEAWLQALAAHMPGGIEPAKSSATTGAAPSSLPSSPPLERSSPAAGVPVATADAPGPPAPTAVAPGPPAPRGPSADRVLRLTAENLNRLLALAGESLVESRWLHPFTESLQRLRRHQADLFARLQALRDARASRGAAASGDAEWDAVTRQMTECRTLLEQGLEELEAYDGRFARLSHRLYFEVLKCRMRPFGDGVRSFPRMVRDLGRMLGKEVRLEIVGENTQVDRDILDKLEAPLTHLLRNAVDHGCEPPAERGQRGKPRTAVVRLEARHSAGMLVVTVSDDGRGLDLTKLRQAVVEKNLAPAAVAERLSETELLEFLFLPGFSLKDTVTEISGRGVGLDVVLNMVRSVRGNIRAATVPGQGMRFQLQLPLTLSVLRTLLLEVAGEPYAIPLAQIAHTVCLSPDQIETLEGRPHCRFGDQAIGLVTLHQVLECPPTSAAARDWPVVIVGDRGARFGLIVDRLLGERELVVQPLDPRLGKIPDVSATALMEDGSPVLILDVDDLIRSIQNRLERGLLPALPTAQSARRPAPEHRRRILAVDDSITVRELVRKLLAGHGFQVDVAVDGMDAWKAVRARPYDLVITDVDMPRMDGIELTRLIKQDKRLRALPVLIVSYKDREEDRLRGLAAGADYYLTKGSFHDETLVQAVLDLIGEPGPATAPARTETHG